MIGMWNIGKYQIYSRNVMFQYLHLSFQMNSRRRYFFVRRKTKSKKDCFESAKRERESINITANKMSFKQETKQEKKDKEFSSAH